MLCHDHMARRLRTVSSRTHVYAKRHLWITEHAEQCGFFKLSLLLSSRSGLHRVLTETTLTLCETNTKTTQHFQQHYKKPDSKHDTKGNCDFIEAICFFSVQEIK